MKKLTIELPDNAYKAIKEISEKENVAIDIIFKNAILDHLVIRTEPQIALYLKNIRKNLKDEIEM